MADNELVEVDSATLQITFPCDSGSISVAMAASVTTVYHGVWNIPSNATYGEYSTKVTASNGGKITVFEDTFFILPWNIIQQIRSTTGIKQSNDIDDSDLAQIAWNAYLEAREDVFKQVVDERNTLCNADVYYISKYVVTDHLICGEDAVTGWYKTSGTCYEIATCSITILDASHGEIEVLDEVGDSLCCQSTYLTYRVKSPSFSESLFKKAVLYLAAHEVILRFNELDKATIADLRSNSPIILANPDRFLKKYKDTLKRIKHINVSGI